MKFQIARDSPIPLHIQLLNELRRAILVGDLKPHAKVVSEPQLATELNISRTTIRQAWQLAEEEGLLYRVHGKGTYVAEPPARRSVQLIGFLIPDFRSTFDSQLLSGAEGYLRGRGFRIMFAHTDRNVDEENHLMREMWEEGVAGFLLWPAMGDNTTRFLFQEAARAIPTVCMDRPLPGLDVPCVASEHYQGGVQATRHLIDLGHTDIGFVSRPHLDLWPIAERLRGYEDTMRQAGLKPRPPILVGTHAELSTRYAQQSYTEERGQEITQLGDVLRRKDRPAAIFAMNDLMALQVLRAASLAGLRIPEDLSLVGFDDMEIVSHVEPPLTTVAQNPYAIGAEAARCLLEMLNGNGPTERLISLPTHLVIRESTAPSHRQGTA